MRREKPFRRNVILGAGGFLGINLAKKLAAEKDELVCFDRFLSPHWPENAKALVGEFADQPVELLDLLEDAVVYHLISSSRPSQRTDNAAHELASDVGTTLDYLEQTKGKNLRWIFFSSGGTVYGATDICPVPENAPTEPICAYGIVKLTTERYFALYRKLHATDHVVARVANPYGAWQDPLRGQGLIPALIYKACAGEAIEIWGDGENIRDYLHVSDVAQAAVELAKYGISGEIYNIGSGHGVSINQLIDIIADTLKLNPEVRYAPARAVDVRRSVLDIGKITRLTEWQPSIALKDGIRTTAEWILQQYFLEKPSHTRN